MVSNLVIVKNSKFYRSFNGDWVESIDDLKTTSRYCFSLGWRVFSWCTKK